MGIPRQAAIQLLVIQGTPFCNLDCRYCYLPNRNDRRRISEETLCQTYARVFESPFLGDNLTVVWHAGEPLVLPISFYERAIATAERMKPAKLAITHSFQTNGTLLTREWAAFLKKIDARTGVSLDGPREMHDSTRRTRSGTGSFDRTMAGIRLLQEIDAPFHVITVLTASSMLAPDQFYDFYRAHHIRNVCFNIEEIEGDNRTSTLNIEEAPALFRAFLHQFLRRIKDDKATDFWVRELAGGHAAIIHAPDAGMPNPQVEPFRILSVDVDGNVSTFSPELLGTASPGFSNFVIGNVYRQSLEEMAEADALKHLWKEISLGVDACRQHCSYFRLCGGGSPANKLFETGTFRSTETMYCRLSRQSVLDVALEDIEAYLHSEGARHAMAATN